MTGDELRRLDDAPALRELRALLERVDLRAQSLAARLGRDDASVLLTQVASYALHVGRKLVESDDPALLWSALLWFGRAIDRAHAGRVLAAEDLALLERLALVETQGSHLVCTVAVTEWEGLWCLSDRLFHFDGAAIRREVRPDAVMPIHYSSLALRAAVARTSPPWGHRRLDLGCGAGFPLLATGEAERVGVDLNERAIAFARVNARLNGTSATWICDDCLTVRPEAPFDRVTFNLPSLPAYADAAPALGGVPDLCRRLFEERLAILLAPDGLFQVWMIFVLTRECRSPEASLASALPHGWQIEVHAEPRSPFALAATAIAERSVPRDSLLLEHAGDGDRLCEYLERSGVVEIASATIDLRRR